MMLEKMAGHFDFAMLFIMSRLKGYYHNKSPCVCSQLPAASSLYSSQ